jgi:hypothetical protein
LIFSVCYFLRVHYETKIQQTNRRVFRFEKREKRNKLFSKTWKKNNPKNLFFFFRNQQNWIVLDPGNLILSPPKNKLKRREHNLYRKFDS